MSPAAERYHQLTRVLIEGRALRLLSEQAEDSLLDEMDDLWWRMTPDEHAEADRWLEGVRLGARDELPLRDTDVSGNAFPRVGQAA